MVMSNRQEKRSNILHNNMTRTGMLGATGIGLINAATFFDSPVPMAVVAATCAIAVHRQASQPLPYTPTHLPSLATSYHFMRKIRNTLYGGVAVLSSVMAALYCTNNLIDANILLKSYLTIMYVASMTTSLTHITHRLFAHAIGDNSSVATFKGLDNITP